MAEATWCHGRTYLSCGLSWTGGEPHLDLVDVENLSRYAVEVYETRLSFSVTGTRFCLGRYVFVSDTDIRPSACPNQLPADSGGQCIQCAAQDEFRFIHHVHRGGYVPQALERYVKQPHWVYLATFADSSTKVGTAADVRKRARLDEQGAVRATYIARPSDGRAARLAEDAISRELGFTQTKRRSAKMAALAAPTALEVIEGIHARQVQQAMALLPSSDATLMPQSWAPPPHGSGFWAQEDSRARALYPHSLTDGVHCLTVRAVLGSVALVTVNDDEEPLVADLGALKGARLIPGHVRSPPLSTQGSLF